MQSIIIIRKQEKKYWGTVRLENYIADGYFCYDTAFFKTINEVKKECKEFCKWKNLKIKKYEVAF